VNNDGVRFRITQEEVLATLEAVQSNKLHVSGILNERLVLGLIQPLLLSLLCIGQEHAWFGDWYN
jgi:hypothetical protein